MELYCLLMIYVFSVHNKRLLKITEDYYKLLEVTRGN